MIHRTPLFAHVPTEGYWRYKDQLVIRRAPDEAPRPFFVSAPHPLVLEVPFQGVSDWRIRNMRAQSSTRQLALFVSLLTPGVHIPPARGDHHWIIKTVEPPSIETEIALAQHHYGIPNLYPYADQLTDQGDLPLIDLVDQLPRGISTGQTLVLPQVLPHALDIFAQLQVKDRRKLLRAAYWLHHADEIWHMSKSGYYQAVVQAVESLTEEFNGDGGATKRFERFVNRFAPSPDVASERARKHLYELRSSLTHGNTLFYMDEETGFGLHGPRPIYERVQADDMQDICRRAVIGWLLDRGKDLPVK